MVQPLSKNSVPLFSQRVLGTGLILMAALCWALSGTAAKHLFQMGITPSVLTQMRATLAGGLMALWIAFKKPSLFRIRQKDLLSFALLGFFGMAMLQYTYLFAISRIHVAVAILIQYMAPAFIFVWSLFFGRKKPSLYALVAILGTVLGCYFVSGASEVPLSGLDLIGIAGGFGAALTFAYYSLSAEGLMRRYDPRTVTVYAFLFSSVSWNLLESPLAFAALFTTPSFSFWGLFVVLVGTLLPFSLYLYGISRVSSVNASITATTEPIFAAAISWVFLGESLSGWQMAGAALVLASIGVLNLKG